MNNAAVPNARRLLLVGFFAIFAAGVGFSVRGAALVHWARSYNFTQMELGEISGGGLWAMGVIFILGSLFADKIGYGPLMWLAVVAHVLCAGLQLCTDQIYNSFEIPADGRVAVQFSLTTAMVLFAVGNGICEVVVNPMVATLYPNNKTHYLNILHAGWPGGLVTGGAIALVMNHYEVYWMIQMSMFLIPVAFYALLMLGQHMPRSEAHEAGVPFRMMLTVFLSPIFLVLLLIHAMVGYVELGSDNWMQNILNRVMGDGTPLFIYTSILMFALRFFGGPIEHRLSPLGLLLISAVIAAIGLTLFAQAPPDYVWLFVVAATVYGIGKTFFWPTMLAVVSERFPRGGALTLGTIGGCGMLSAGLLGSPGIGFKQDYYTVQEMKEKPETKAVYERYAAKDPKHFLGFEVKPLDAQKTNLLDLYLDIEKLKATSTDSGVTKDKKNKLENDDREFNKRLEHDEHLAAWWKNPSLNVKAHAESDAKPIHDAQIYGGQMAFQLTALVPVAMAVLYLLLILYFKAQGGYKPLAIDQTAAEQAPGDEF
jgi:MFS family permease